MVDSACVPPSRRAVHACDASFPVGRTPGHELWNELGDGGRSSSRSGSPRSRDGVPFASGELNAMADIGDRRVPSTRWQGPLGCGDHRGSIRPLRASAGRGVRPSGHRLHRPHRRSALRSRRHRPVPRRGIEQPCTTGARMRIRLHPSTVMANGWWSGYVSPESSCPLNASGPERWVVGSAVATGSRLVVPGAKPCAARPLPDRRRPAAGGTCGCSVMAFASPGAILRLASGHGGVGDASKKSVGCRSRARCA